ncbi:MAG: DUF4249 domain-containing protein [Prolixibacteraceae bacterium]
MPNKTQIVLLFSLLFTACVERYFIEDIDELASKIVIEGTITDLCEPQEIVISMSSDAKFAEFYPYSQCEVILRDSGGVLFYFEESKTQAGHYIGEIDEHSLVVGNQFKVEVKTPDGKQYESSYEEMLPCPEIDSIYYQQEQHPTSEEGNSIDGIQFFINFEASNYFGHHYRWIVEESYEYHSFWPIKNYYDESNRFISIVGPADYSKFVCYKTEVVDDIITLSTSNLTQNRFAGAKLLFVDDHTQRLLYNYSILVKQISLDEKAYNYWEKTKKNNKSNGGLFTKQPGRIIGNIVNLNDSTERVLGYFGVSSVTSKRVVVPAQKDLSFKDLFICKPSFLKYSPLPWEPRPIYLFYAVDPADGSWQPAWSVAECVDCTSLGGVVEKPVYFE